MVRRHRKVDSLLLKALGLYQVAGGACAADNAVTALFVRPLVLGCSRAHAPKTVHAEGDEAQEGEVELYLPVVGTVSDETVERSACE